VLCVKALSSCVYNREIFIRSRITACRNKLSVRVVLSRCMIPMGARIGSCFQFGGAVMLFFWTVAVAIRFLKGGQVKVKR